MAIAVLLLVWLQLPAVGSATLTVTAHGVPVTGAAVTATITGSGAGRTDGQTDGDGRLRLELPAGTADLVVSADGFAPATARITIAAGQDQPVSVELERLPSVEESVTVLATRAGRGLQDEPLRVEVLDQEEIEEKRLMTPGDIVMMLNEMGGMRVQATAPALGAASLRIQGMRGRYTRILSDGLPLFGQQVSFGLMQVPPIDLGRAEVIKGTASSLYGAGAMGGVVNLVSRRPGERTERQLLVNRSSRGATDGAFWYSAPLAPHWGLTLLVSGNGQSRTDVDGDGWSDLARYGRGLVRPRLFWDDGAGRSLFATVGGTWEDRVGGTRPGALLAATGAPWIESLGTRRGDAGVVLQIVSGATIWGARGSWTTQRQSRRFGDRREHDDHGTGFGELTARRAVGRHTVVGGGAVEFDRFRPRERTDLAYTVTTPGVFVQDDVDVARWLVVSASARIDHHSRYGTFASPQVAALLRSGGAWSSRVSFGTGFVGPTPLGEETDAAGLARLTIPSALRAERGRSGSIDLTRRVGPLSTTLTLFASRIAHPVSIDRDAGFALVNLPEPTTNRGVELVGVWRKEAMSMVANYAFVDSRETQGGVRREVALTPRHSVGANVAWEQEGRGRIGVEWYYTGAQALEENPWQARGRAYSVFGVLATRRAGRAMLFVNGENLTNVRQTQWAPLVRPARAADGRWTVDAWAPLDGRNVNAGVQVSF